MRFNFVLNLQLIRLTWRPDSLWSLTTYQKKLIQHWFSPANIFEENKAIEADGSFSGDLFLFVHTVEAKTLLYTKVFCWPLKVSFTRKTVWISHGTLHSENGPFCQKNMVQRRLRLLFKRFRKAFILQNLKIIVSISMKLSVITWKMVHAFWKHHWFYII